MRKIKEVLRLKFDVGLGLRQIARSCAIGLGTAHEYLQRAEAAKITWPLGPEWDDDRLRPRCSAGRLSVARWCWPCPTSPTFIVSGSNIHTTPTVSRCAEIRCLRTGQSRAREIFYSCPGV